MENKPLTNHDLNKNPLQDFYNMGHEKILICQDEKTGLKAIVAVHSTICGPALGGTRMWNLHLLQMHLLMLCGFQEE